VGSKYSKKIKIQTKTNVQKKWEGQNRIYEFKIWFKKSSELTDSDNDDDDIEEEDFFRK
jgi:hypothetical protein